MMNIVLSKKVNKNNKVGRPRQDVDKRGKLINVAKILFVKHDYDKVSIRAIANDAGVDSALIRYYFQSKLGLFTAMMQEMTAPISSQLTTLNQSVDNNSPSELMNTYYQIMSQNPDFPKLIFKIASMPQTAKNQALKDILDSVLTPKNMKLFTNMHQQEILQEGVDPTCLGISFFSMMIFPFLMPDVLKQALQLDITPEFMTHLAKQNSQLLKQGFIKNEPNKELS